MLVQGVSIRIRGAGDWCSSRPALVRDSPRSLARVVVRHNLDLDRHALARRGSGRRRARRRALRRHAGASGPVERRRDPGAPRPGVDAPHRGRGLDVVYDIGVAEAGVAREDAGRDAGNV